MLPGELRAPGASPGPPSAGDGARIRARFALLFYAVAAALLGSAWLTGLVGRAPVVAAAVLLVGALARGFLAWLRGRLDRWFWLIRWKLAVSYLVIAFVPLLLVTGMLCLVGYLAIGQFLAVLSSHRLKEIADEVDHVAEQIIERTEAVRDEPDLAVARKLAEGHDGGEELRALGRRYQPDELDSSGKSWAVSASAVGLDGSGRGEIEFPRLPFSTSATRFERPAWMAGEEAPARVTIRRIRQRSGQREVLEIRGARRARGRAREVYVEVAVALGEDVLRRIRAPLGVDLRIVRPMPRGQAPQSLIASVDEFQTRRGLVGGLPFLGVSSLDPIDWDSGRAYPESRLLVVQRSVGGLYEELRAFGQQNRSLIFLVVFIAFAAFAVVETLSLAVGLELARSITGSIQSIFDGTARVERGDLSHRIAVTSADQLGSLTQSFNRMTESVERLVAQSAESERLEEELRIGRRIQQSLLPPGELRDSRFDIAALSLPAKEVGGDYFDFFDLGGGKLALLIADVSGKGTEAAFYMAEVKGIMLALARVHGRPLDVLTEANSLLGTSLDRRTFVTMTYGVLDRERGEFSFARAGHNPILHLPAGEGCARSLRPPGLALGLDRGHRFRTVIEERSVWLEPGALLLLYTDGVTDTMSDSGELYGEERLARALESARDRSADAVRDGIAAELRRFAAAGPPHDDLTLVVVRAL